MLRSIPSLRSKFIDNIIHGNRELVRKIIKKAKQLNVDIGINSPVEAEYNIKPIPSQSFPLHLAVRQADPEMMALLLKYGAINSVNQCDQTKETPLSLAIKKKRPSLIDALLDHPQFILDDNIGAAILNAVASNDLGLTKRLLAKATTKQEKKIIKDALRIWTQGDKSALHIAVDLDNVPLVELLLDYGADPHLEIQDKDQQPVKTPWNLARQNNRTMAEAMVKHEGFTLPKNFDYQIYYETKKKHHNIVRALLEKAKSEHKDNELSLVDQDKNTSLHHAVLNNDEKMVQILLEFGAIECANALNKKNETPLSLGFKKKNVTIVKLILNHPQFAITSEIGPALLNSVMKKSLPTIHLLEKATTEQEKEIVKTALNTWTSHKRFCLHIAVKMRDASLVHWLMQYGADPHAPSTHPKKDKVKTPWQLARKQKTPKIAQLMAQDEYFSLPADFTKDIYYEAKNGHHTIVRALLEKAKSENEDNGLFLVGKNENSSLHHAVLSNDKKMVQILLEFGAIEVASQSNNENMTPLALSIKNKTFFITNLFLNHPDFVFDIEIASAILAAVNDGDADLTERLLKKAETLRDESLVKDVLNQNAKDALYIAVMSADSRLVALLMAYGANPHAENTKGDTPLSLAKRLALEDNTKQCTLLNTLHRKTYEAILTSPYYLDANAEKKYLDDMDFVAIVAPYQKMLTEHTPLSQEQQAALLKLAPRNRYAKELIADMGLLSTNRDDLRQAYAQLAEEDDYAYVMHAKLNRNVTLLTLFKAFYLAKTHPLKRHFMKEWINDLALDQSSPLRCQASLLHALLHTNAAAWDAARCVDLDKFKETVIHLVAFLKAQNESILDADTLKILEEVANGNTSVNLGIDSTIDQLPITPELKQIMHNIIYTGRINHNEQLPDSQLISFIQQALECYWKAKLPTSYSEKLLKKAQVILFGLIHEKPQVDKSLLAQVQYALEGLMFVKQNPTPTDLQVPSPPASEPNFSFQTMGPPPPYPHKQASGVPAEAQPSPMKKNIAEESTAQPAGEESELYLSHITDMSENTVSEFPFLTTMLKYLDENGTVKDKQKLNEALDALTQLYADKYSLETKNTTNEVEVNNTAPAGGEIEKNSVQANPVPIPSPTQQVQPSATLVSITQHSIFRQSAEPAITAPTATQTNAENLTQAEEVDVSDLYEQLKHLKPLHDVLPIPEATASIESDLRADEENSIEETECEKTQTRRRAFG